MTKKELYTCDICHTDYCNKEDALQCEKDHLKCVKITGTRYNAPNYCSKCGCRLDWSDED